MLLTSSGFVYSFGDKECCGHELDQNTKNPEMIYDLLEVFVTSIYCTSITSLCIGRGRDVDCPLEVNFKRIKDLENIEEELLEDPKLIISKGQIFYVWGKANTGCLGFGDEVNI